MRFYVPPFHDHTTQTRAFRQAFAKFGQVIRQAECDYWDTLRPLLPPPVAQLMGAHLHDAYIDILRWDGESKELALRLTECGDNPGFFCLNLLYHGVTMASQQEETLSQVAQEPSAQIAFHEIDILQGDAPLVFVQRTLWNTNVERGRKGHMIDTWKPETQWQFTGLEIEAVPWQEPYPAPVRQITGLP
ncbi:MAG: hypothetical protein H7Y38_15380 [Armatimonadetes bacterium]|nr:hypothetical protein [Armatimonadota bacterium]